MLDLATLEKYDKKRMYQVYDSWPNVAKQFFDMEYEVEISRADHVVFAGMGGSGAIGDIFSSILSQTDNHVSVVKGYLLPKTVDSNTLVVCTSISGNTVETLTVLRSAMERGCKIISFSSGGKMEKYCQSNKITHVKLSQLHSPRASFTVFLYSMLKSLHAIIPLKQQEILDSIVKLEQTRSLISSTNLTESNPSLKLAQWLVDIPMIYYPFGLQAAAIRFKNSLQENAKKHAMVEDVVEACHNGIVSWETLSNIQPILLRGQDDYIKTKERWEILKEYFKLNKIEYQEIFSVEGNILTKLINLIYLLDYSTIYSAVLSKVDPSPINSIDFVKEKLDSLKNT